MKTQALWKDKLILDPNDADQLETAAAEREFKDRKSRVQAETETHDDYKKSKHREGAAFHLSGMRAAQAINQMDEAKKHGALYVKHMKALGHDPVAEPPAEIQKLTEGEDQKKVYKFKAHAADQFVVEPQTSEKKEDAPMSDEKEMTKAEKLRKFWDEKYAADARGQRLDVLAKAVGMLTKKERSSEETPLAEETPGEHTRHELSPMHKTFSEEEMNKMELGKVAPPEFSEDTMHKLKRKHGEESAFKIAWAAHRKHKSKSEPVKKAEKFFETYKNHSGFTYDERQIRKDEETIRATPEVKAPPTPRLSKEESQLDYEKRVALKKTEKEQRAADVKARADEFFGGYGNTPGFSYE